MEREERGARVWGGAKAVTVAVVRRRAMAVNFIVIL
jgi:hypothetical protein